MTINELVLVYRRHSHQYYKKNGTVTREATIIDGCIPHDYHKPEGNYLCLGAPMALRMTLTLNPTLLTFLESLVIPYLARYSYFAQHVELLYGELEHGNAGIRQYLGELFQSKTTDRAEEFVRLASLKKRTANKPSCPCRSGRRLGKCHNRIVTMLRKQLGRK